MKLFILDDHEIFRVGLKTMLAADAGDWQVVGEAGSAREAFPLISATQPDVVVLDLVLPGMDGCSAVREVRRRTPDVAVLMLTLSHSHHDVVEAFDAGVRGYALKSDSRTALFEALASVARGEQYIDPLLAEQSRPTDGVADAGVLAALSKREREIFRLAAHGLANGDIAGELCISRKTVETHRYRIQRRFGLRTPNDLIRFAARQGLIQRPHQG
jgi:DNA-binding NarL/FixJ family response regulator